MKKNAEETRVTLENMLALTTLPDKLEPIAKHGPGSDLTAYGAPFEYPLLLHCRSKTPFSAQCFSAMPTR